MRRSGLWVWGAGAMVALSVGCPSNAPRGGVPPFDAGLGADGGSAAAEPPPPLAFTVSYESPDGGWVGIPVEPGTRPMIEPTQALSITANRPLANYRMRVFDEADRILPSDDRALAATGPDQPPVDYRIRFAAPLRTGHRYALVIDAQSGDAFTDQAGQPQQEQRIGFQVSGEKEKPAPPKKKPASKRRRH